MFGRSRKEDTVQEEVEEEVRPQLYDESELWQIPGPREEYEVDNSVDYVDLGSLRIPAVPPQRRVRAELGMNFVRRFALPMKRAAVQLAKSTLATVMSLKLTRQ